MFFVAELKDRKFRIHIFEETNFYRITIQDESQLYKDYIIQKKDFNRSEFYYSFLFQGVSYLVDVIGKDLEYTVFTRNSYRKVKIYNDEILLHESLKRDGFQKKPEQKLVAGMPGKIIQIFVEPGEIVKANRPLLIMEAMKMENELRSVTEVKIKSVLVQQGQRVEANQTLIEFE